MIEKEIGNRIHDRRKELKMTLQDVADRVSVARSTIQRYEAGTIQQMKMPVLYSIAQAISVNPDWLIGKSAIKETSETGDSLQLSFGLMTAGERIKSRRKALGISAEDLASFLHIPPASVYRYENGDTEQFPIDYLVPTAGFLRTTTSYLLGLNDDPDSVIASPFPGSNLTAAEIELLHRYRRAPQNIKDAVDAVLTPYGEQSANPASSEQSVG